MIIELTDNQTKKYNDWIATFEELPYIGATGGHFGLKIIFTSIGPVISGTSWIGQEINLTELEEL